MLDGAILGAEDTTRSVLDRLEHDDRAERAAHAHRPGARPSTNAATSAPVPVTVANTSAAAGGRGRLRLRRRQRHRRHGRVGQRQQRHADERDLGRRDGRQFGNALSFNGTNASVSIPDSNSLDLTTGMTIEAWINPTALGNTWRTVALKEQPGYYAYGSTRAPEPARPSRAATG